MINERFDFAGLVDALAALEGTRLVVGVSPEPTDGPAPTLIAHGVASSLRMQM